MRLALAQFNAVVGDIDGNCDKMCEIYASAVDQGVDLLVFPELAVCGYPPEDLVYQKQFVEDNQAAVQCLADQCPGIAIVVGFVERAQSILHNAAAVLRNGRLEMTYRKGVLPNFSVFDEQRYFKPGTEPVFVEVAGQRIALTICFDLWNPDWLRGFFRNAGRFDMVLNISASPFHVGKIATREHLLWLCATTYGCAVSYCNLVGGQDELVFDGRSMVADSTGKIVAQAKAFEEDLLIVDVASSKDGVHVQPIGPSPKQLAGVIEEVYGALILGTRDYALKNGFTKVLLGVSGGVDSAVTAAVAVAALGPQNVTAITMPSRFSSRETIRDAEQVARNLGIELLTIPIEPVLSAFHQSLKAAPGWDDRGIAYENLQARIRGTILMSLSNQQKALVLTTGNKSEIAVGYSTLYGDTAGGFAVIKDVPKTMVYQLADFINQQAGRPIIPAETIARAPTAELRPNQKDTDSLPDYEVLDGILKAYVEHDLSARQIIDTGLPAETVYKVIRLVDSNEYKRRQSPPGVRITPKAFGKDRRLPITNHYRPTADSS